MVLSADEQRERRRMAVIRSRERETDDARLKRQQRDRERHRRAYWALSADERHQRWHSTVSGDEASQQSVHESSRAWLDGEIPRLHPVSNRTQDRVLHELRLRLRPSGLDETTCAVCDCSERRKSIHMIAIVDSDSIQRMHSVLCSAGENLSAALLAEYDCSEMFEELKGILLSKRGVHPDVYVQVCQQCHESLEKQTLPKFAIKNGFYVGLLPGRFADVTLPERLMTQIVSIVAVTRVMRGEAHRSIRSHCVAFDSTPGPAATLLPRSVRDVVSYRVILAGPFTTEQQARVRRMHLVRRQVVEDLIMFYREQNPMYESITIDCSELAEETLDL